jgi:Bardet-Biedl syndrome 5 protein
MRATKLPHFESEHDMMQHNVEDTKAGKYERGRLLITTLRVIWFSAHSTTINLCVGIQTITKVDMSTKARSGVHPAWMQRTALVACLSVHAALFKALLCAGWTTHCAARVLYAVARRC